MTVWRQFRRGAFTAIFRAQQARAELVEAGGAEERTLAPFHLRLVILGDKLKPDDGDCEQDERDDQRAKRVREMNVIGAGFEAG